MDRWRIIRSLLESGKTKRPVCGTPGKVHLPPGGTLVSPAGSCNLVGAVSIGQAMPVANWSFLERAVGEIGPPARPKGWIFLFFFIDLSFL